MIKQFNTICTVQLQSIMYSYNKSIIIILHILSVFTLCGYTCTCIFHQDKFGSISLMLVTSSKSFILKKSKVWQQTLFFFPQLVWWHHQCRGRLISVKKVFMKSKFFQPVLIQGNYWLGETLGEFSSTYYQSSQVSCIEHESHAFQCNLMLSCQHKHYFLTHWHSSGR